MRLNLFPSRATPVRSGRVPVRLAIQAGTLALFLGLFLYVCWPYGAHHQAEAMRAREVVEAETFLLLDPLVGAAAALAARRVALFLAWTGAVVLAGVLLPRVFCGYVCPLGTLIDGADALTQRMTRFRGRLGGGARRARFVVLAVVLGAAAGGVMLAGYVAPVPVLTRGLLFSLGDAQLAVLRGPHLIPPWTGARLAGALLLLAIPLLGLLAPRFWCRCLCPSGALLSLTGRWGLIRRRVSDRCTRCGACVSACPFGAIGDDIGTRPADCVSCQTCGAVCPVGAISFESPARPATPPTPAGERALTRRTFVMALAGAGVAAVAAPRLAVPRAGGVPVRPPGSVPEAEFLRLCVRCGECIKACPFNVLQAAGLEDGRDGVWAPRVQADWSGCDPTCNNCGQVCPTGAIRALPLEEKRVARMGVAVINRRTCLPCAGREACRLCVDECHAAGYDAIEVERRGVETDEAGEPVEGTGVQVPVVIESRCVGCGLCQARCRAINVTGRGLLRAAAVTVVAGTGHEDRLRYGSYRAARAARRLPAAGGAERGPSAGDYVPDFLR